MLRESGNKDIGYEASILAKIKHPLIIKYIEDFETRDAIYLVIEYQAGGDLQMYMEKRNFEVLEEERVKALATKIAQGLKYLHDRGIVHRDIKPENILLTDVSDTSAPIISDFGYSQHLKEGQTLKKFVGTKKYVAPEVLDGQAYSFPVDIWGFGILLYVLIADRTPFPLAQPSMTKKNLSEFARVIYKTELKFEGSAWLLISDEFIDLIKGMLEKD